MKKVKLIGPGLKLNNSWHWCGDEVVISDDDYENNEKYLNVIEDLENEITLNNNQGDEESNVTNNNGSEDERKNEEGSSDDEELEILREKAKELGISNCGRMKKETLIEKIAEKETENGESEEITEE